MQFGLHLPNIKACADAQVLADIAAEAEAAAWDGVFVWDAFYLGPGHPHFADPQPACDAWVAMTAMVQQTTRVRIGPLLCAPARLQPWYLARRMATLDVLSGGRMVLPVGFGDVSDGGFRCVGQDASLRGRVDRLDESLEILNGLWSGEPFRFEGQHFTLEEMTILPVPIQRPRVPIWVWALWPRMKTINRAVRCDGVFAFGMNDAGDWHELSPQQVAELRAAITPKLDGRNDFDIVMEASSPFDFEEKPVERVREYADAGVTWWLDSTYKAVTFPDGSLDKLMEHVRCGPPQL